MRQMLLLRYSRWWLQEQIILGPTPGVKGSAHFDIQTFKRVRRVSISATCLPFMPHYPQANALQSLEALRYIVPVLSTRLSCKVDISALDTAIIIQTYLTQAFSLKHPPTIAQPKTKEHCAWLIYGNIIAAVSDIASASDFSSRWNASFSIFVQMFPYNCTQIFKFML